MTKFILLISFFLPSFISMGQIDTVRPAVYSWKNLKSETVDGRERKQVLKGSTLDLAELEVHTTTLGPWQVPHSPHTHDDFEELIIVKDGKLKVTIEDSSKIIGPGGFALIVAGDHHGFQNASDDLVTYFIIKLKPKSLEKNKNRHSSSLVRDWTELAAEKTNKGERRSIFDNATPLLRRFEMHSTSLDAGFASHDPHTHRAAEIILMIKGNVEMQIGQQFYPATGGDLVFLSSGILHALKNVGNERCSYFAIQFE